MSSTVGTPSARDNPALRAILLGGLLAGLADFLFATIRAVMAGNPALRPWKGVASGLLGQTARDGDAGMAMLGVLLHFFICVAAAALLYSIVSRVKDSAPVDRPGNPLWQCIPRGHELRDPAALGHWPGHLSTEPDAHQCILAHRPGGSADVVLHLARTEGICDALIHAFSRPAGQAHAVTMISASRFSRFRRCAPTRGVG